MLSKKTYKIKSIDDVEIHYSNRNALEICRVRDISNLPCKGCIYYEKCKERGQLRIEDHGRFTNKCRRI